MYNVNRRSPGSQKASENKDYIYIQGSIYICIYVLYMRFQRSQCRNGSRNFTIVNGVHKIYNMEKKGIKTIHARKDVRLEGNANALVTFQGVLGIRIYLRYTSYRNGSVAYPFT